MQKRVFLVLLLSTVLILSVSHFVIAQDATPNQDQGFFEQIGEMASDFLNFMISPFTESEPSTNDITPGECYPPCSGDSYCLDGICVAKGPGECDTEGETKTCSEVGYTEECTGSVVCQDGTWVDNCKCPDEGCTDPDAVNYDSKAGIPCNIERANDCCEFYDCDVDDPIDGPNDAWVYWLKDNSIASKKTAYCSQSKDGYYTYSCDLATIKLGDKTISWKEPVFTKCEDGTECIEDAPPGLGKGENGVYCNSSTIKIKSVELNVSDKFKKEYHLAQDYETEGLNALVNTQDKCEDCAEKSKIKGIITEYDDLIATVKISTSQPDDGSKGYKVKVNIDGSANLNKEIDFSDCASETETDYICKIYLPKSKGLLSRGTEIFAKAELYDKDNLLLDKDESNSLVVAMYNLFTFSKTGWTEGQGEQYYGFNRLSEINSKIKYAAKPVYIKDIDLQSRDPSDNYLFLSKKIAGFSKQSDPFIFYTPDVKVYTGGSTAGVATYESGNLFGKAIIFLLAKNPKARIVYMGSSQTRLSVLAHELGHWYGLYLDEYSWETYEKQKAFGTSVVNANSQDGGFSFPLCCQRYVCCSTNSVYKWLPDFKCNSPESLFLQRRTVPDYYCKSSEHPVNSRYFVLGRCYYGEEEALDQLYNRARAISIPEDQLDRYIIQTYGYYRTVSVSFCKGMPYSDKETHSPTDLNPDGAQYWSVMGSEELFDISKLVYPEPSVCPLKHCDD